MYLPTYGTQVYIFSIRWGHTLSLYMYIALCLHFKWQVLQFLETPHFVSPTSKIS